MTINDKISLTLSYIISYLIVWQNANIYFIILYFYSCDYNKYTLLVVKRIASLQINELKEEVKTENESMEVDEINIINVQ